MNIENDDLLSFGEFAKKINKSQPYLCKLKNPGKLDPAISGKKISFLKGCEILKIDPDNIPLKTTKQLEQAKHQALKAKSGKNYFSKNQIKVKAKKPPIVKTTNEETFDEFDNKAGLEHTQDLLKQIEDIIKSKPDDKTYIKLDSLETKTKILKNFYAAEKEKLSYEKELSNLFDAESIERILSFSFNAVRNTLLNLANNYAVNLEGLSKGEIKNYVEEDINKILEELQNVSKELK